MGLTPQQASAGRRHVLLSAALYERWAASAAILAAAALALAVATDASDNLATERMLDGIDLKILEHILNIEIYY